MTNKNNSSVTKSCESIHEAVTPKASQQEMTSTTKIKSVNSVIVSVKNLVEKSDQVDEVTVCINLGYL